MPDFSFENMPQDYAAIVLIGGYSWNSQEAQQVIPIMEQAIANHKIVGAICNGASFLASCGFLNQIKHTDNGLDQLKLLGKENYTNEVGFVERQAVSDNNIVAANGTGCLEFAKEILMLLKADT